jgi:hypothetical protein
MNVAWLPYRLIQNMIKYLDQDLGHIDKRDKGTLYTRRQKLI